MNTIWNIKLFAGLQERLGSAVVTIETSRTEMTAGELKTLIADRYPGEAGLVAGSFIARNLTYAADGETVRVEEELALLPPVSGGEEEHERPEAASSGDRYIVASDKLNADDVLSKVIVHAHGASLVFVGTTREWTEGKRTVRLEYEAYVPMAVAAMKQIGDEIADRWPGALCAISHRTGIVELGEASVVIAVSAPHREACYEASRYAIERLKQIVPIWKKEIWADGSEWKGHQLGPWDPTAPPAVAGKENV